MTEKSAVVVKDDPVKAAPQPGQQTGPVDPDEKQRGQLEGIRDSLDSVKDDLEDLLEGSGGTGFVARDGNNVLASVNNAIDRIGNLLTSYDDQQRTIEGDRPERERQVINARVAGIPAPGEKVDPDTGDIVDAKGRKVDDAVPARKTTPV